MSGLLASVVLIGALVGFMAVLLALGWVALLCLNRLWGP
jgi:hypothetical protein